VKVVLDANVLVAAYASRGLCRDLFELCLVNHTLILSETLLDEVRGNLVRKLGYPPSGADEIRKFLACHAVIAKPAILPSNPCRDPDDLHVLGLAEAARCDHLVTGDNDLLVLKSFRGIPIVTPRDFWAQLNRAEKQ
jgi:uncharacterized protein